MSNSTASCVDEKKSNQFDEVVVGNLKIKAFDYDNKLWWIFGQQSEGPNSGFPIIR